MKLLSWNVNGIRAVHKKGLFDFLEHESPDIFCVQETKAHPEQLDDELKNPFGMSAHYSSASKKGYSGVATFSTEELDSKKVKTGIGESRFDDEGRFVISEHGNFTLYNIYFPSGTTGDVRQDFKYAFLDTVYDHLKGLSKAKRNKAIICGDFNICHRRIDIHHPDTAEKRELSGFLPDERSWMDKFVELGFVDSFRHVHGGVTDRYSWWSYRAGARGKNLGWRIDYFFVPEAMKDTIVAADILSDVTGSDHAPLVLELDI